MSVFGFTAWSVAALVVILLVTALSRRIGWSAPLVLVAVGIGAEFVPWVPRVQIDPNIVLIGVLPALLFASALRTSFLEVRARGDSILVLSVGLVVFTAFAVGLVTWWLVPGITFAIGIAFGAIVAPTDAVSVAAIVGEGRVPRRLEALLESEGLLNDATALVTLNTAIAAITKPGGFGPGQVALNFGLAVVVGAASGALISWIVSRVRRRLSAPVLDTSVSLASPYLAYLPASYFQGSGFLAVAMTGIWLAYRSPAFQSAESRVAERINWRTISYLLENAVFLLIGLQLPGIVATTLQARIGVLPGILIIAAIYLAMVLARFVWVFAASLIYRIGPEWWQDRRWNRPTSIAISFSGVRGVVTLAAVFLLPRTGPLTNIVGFLQLTAFVVVVVSLLQGLAIGPLVRALRLPLPNPEQDVVQIRSLTAEAQEAAVKRLDRETTPYDTPGLVRFLRESAAYRQGIAEARSDGMAQQDDYARLRLLMLDSERRAVLEAQRDGRYEEDVIQAVLGDFDSIETALARSRRRDVPDAPVPRLSLATLSTLSLRRLLRSPPHEE